MWGPYATRMQSYLDAQRAKDSAEPIVVIIQIGRLTKYLGNIVKHLIINNHCHIQ